MSTDPDHVDPRTAEADRADARRPAGADRLPTPEEERLAERAERDLEPDLADVAEHYEEMTRLGAEVKGEGEIPG